MELFQYEATTREGNIVTGTVEVSDERSAIDRIQDMGYFPIKVNKAVESESVFDRFITTLRGRVTEKDIMTFTYQLGVLLDAGFALDKSLSILSDLTEKKKLRELIKELMSHVRSGKSLSDSLSKFPSAFPLFYVNMIKAGEAGGYLEDTISRMATYLENSQALKEETRSAMIYPLILSVAGGGAVVVLLTFVVPKFTKIFTDMGEALPLPTIILLAISSTLINYWWVMVFFLVIVFIAARKYLKSESGIRTWDRFKFQIPLFGKLFKETAVSRFARTFGTLLSSGVPLLNALQIVRGTLGSRRISEVIANVRVAARKGNGHCRRRDGQT
jgi:general secretion pathway protein F